MSVLPNVDKVDSESFLDESEAEAVKKCLNEVPEYENIVISNLARFNCHQLPSIKTEELSLTLVTLSHWPARARQNLFFRSGSSILMHIACVLLAILFTSYPVSQNVL